MQLLNLLKSYTDGTCSTDSTDWHGLARIGTDGTDGTDCTDCTDCTDTGATGADRELLKTQNRGVASVLAKNATYARAKMNLIEPKPNQHGHKTRLSRGNKQRCMMEENPRPLPLF